MSGTTFSKLPVMIVALVIGLILTFTAVMPLVDDYSGTKTFTNDGFYRMKEIANGDTWVKTSGGTWTYNTDDVIIYSDGAFNMVLGDNWCVRANGTARGTFVSGGAQDTTVVSASDVITISGTGITSTDTPEISGYGGYSTGSYILTKPSVPVYVNSDTPIYATGTTEIPNSTPALFHIEGNIDDGVTITAYSTHSMTAYDSITTSNVEINYTAVDGYLDLYKLASITFDITAIKTVSDTPTTYTASATYNSYVVPYEVTADPDNPTAYKNLVSVLPLFALILLVAGAATLVYFKNKD